MRVKRQSKSEKNIGYERKGKHKKIDGRQMKKTRVITEKIEVEKVGNLWKGL